MEFWIDIEDSAGNKLGPGPIATATSWQSTPRLDEAGTFSFEMPATDPQAALLANKRIARCWGIVDGVVTELGAGVIDEIAVQLGDPTVLRISGPDLLAELAGRTVGSLHICGQELVYLNFDPALGTHKGAVRWLGDNYGVTWEHDLPELYDGITASGGEKFRLWREAVIYAEWLYVGYDARFDFARVTLTDVYIEINQRATTLVGQYFDGNGWADLPNLVDGTRGWVDFAGHWATMNRSGDITWTRPANWARCTPTRASGSWFWVRFTVHSGERTEDFVLREIAVWADVPTTDGVNQIMAYAPATWRQSGYPATVTAKYIEFDGESVLAALRLLSEQGGQLGGVPVREHFRLGSGREIDWFSTWTATGLRAVSAEGLAAEGYDELVLITELARRRDTTEVVTRLYPWSKEGITLAATTRTAPAGYILSKVNGYLEHAAGAMIYGRIEAALRFSELSAQQEDSYFIHPTMVANALFDRALEWLRTRAVAQDYYDLAVTKAGVLRPGQTINVVYHEFVDGYHAVDIDTVFAGTPLYILAATMQVDGEGFYTVALEVATADRQATDDVGVLTSTIENVRRLEAGGSAVWQVAFGAGGVGQQIFEGPGIDITGDGVERTVGLGGDTILLLRSNRMPVAEFNPDAAGMSAACAAAVWGDVILLPVGRIEADVLVPAGVTLQGHGWASSLNGMVTLADGARVEHLCVYQSVNTATDVLGVIGPSSGAAVLRDVQVALVQAGTGKALGLLANGGILRSYGCEVWVQGAEGSAWGYAAAIGGRVELHQGAVKAWRTV